MTRAHRQRRPQRGGFTILEMLVTIVVVALTLGAAVGLFNSMNKLSRVQLHTAELQQSVRVAQREIGRMIQMAGRGGLSGYNNVGPALLTPALAVRDNVGEDGSFFTDRNIAEGVADSPQAVTGTDILTVRGAFDSSVFHVNYADRTKFDPGTGDGGTIVLGNRTPTGIPQDLRPIKWACDPPEEGATARPEALVLVNAVNEENYAVVELDCSRTEHGAIPEAFVPGAPFTEYTIGFLSAADTGFTYANQYATRLTPNGANPDLTGNFNPSFVALVEEYRFYVRERCGRYVNGVEWAEAPCTADGAVPAHRFSMARMYPGTEVAHGGDDANLRLDVSDSIIDFQAALGFDSSYHADGGASQGFFTFDADNLGGDDIVYEAANGTSDDWLFNGVADSQSSGSHFQALPWSPPVGGTFTGDQPQPHLYYVRVSTLGFTARPDRGYQAPLLDAIENHVVTDDPLINGEQARLFRRELLQTVIDLRNL